MSELKNLTEDEVIKINRIYNPNTQDVFLQKRLSNIEKNRPWLYVKNNTKSNKLKKKKELKIKTDPYKFKKIPADMKQIILNLCQKNDIGLQTLAVKANLPLHIIDNYINGNYILDNYDLHIILKTLNFDLIKYIDDNK